MSCAHCYCIHLFFLLQDAQLERLERDRELSEANLKPILPRPSEGEGKKTEVEDVDMAELQPVDPDNPVIEPTPLPEELDR